jgi:hypothetical protein
MVCAVRPVGIRQGRVLCHCVESRNTPGRSEFQLRAPRHKCNFHELEKCKFMRARCLGDSREKLLHARSRTLPTNQHTHTAGKFQSLWRWSGRTGKQEREWKRSSSHFNNACRGLTELQIIILGGSAGRVWPNIWQTQLKKLARSRSAASFLS